MSENVVSGRGIVKTFKDFWGRDKVKALKGIDLDIPKGSIFGLLGPNGAGKSTLIKILLGHLYPTSGKIAVFGEDPRNVKIKFKIGYLPERSYLYKNLTAEETLKYFGEILNLSPEQIENRTTQLLQMVGLQNSRKRYVGEFSHGMTRRMGMAQALLNDPEFIILDEPTAGLDPIGCREVKDLILTLGRRGKTILLTSHLLADVEDVCDDVMVIFGGGVQSQGKMSELLADDNRVKVEFPAGDPEKIKKISEILGDTAEFSSPKQSLESYFLGIVNEGSKNMETAGAQMGTGVAEYLRGDIENPVPAEPAPVKDETPVPAEPAPVKDETPVPAEPAPVKDETPVPAEPAPVKGESPAPVEPAPVKGESPAPVEPAPVKGESPAPVEPASVKGETVDQKDKGESLKEQETPVEDSIDTLKASAHRPDLPVEHPEDEDDETDDELDEDLLDKLN